MMDGNKQMEGKVMMNSSQQVQEHRPGKSTSTTLPNSNEVVSKNAETHLQSNANEQTIINENHILQQQDIVQVDSERPIDSNAKEKNKGVSDTHQHYMGHNVVPQSNFPQISNNFVKHIPNPQNKDQMSDQAPTKIPPNQANQNPNKKGQIDAPSAYTVVQTLAARLRLNQAKQDSPIEIASPKITTKQGLPAVIFNRDDFMIKLGARCRFTLVGKFSNTMPKVELIRRSFILQTQFAAGVKIAHFNARHVYIDLDNELDYITVWTKQIMSIEGQLMRIQTWTPTFRPEEETPIVPIWVYLPELPWHCYNKEFVSALLSPIGKVLYLDNASIQKTRGSLAKVRVQVDLTKERPPHVWMGFDEEDITLGRWQAIQYEYVPDYCNYCKHQGHRIHACTVKERDDEQKKRKELEAERKNKNKGDTEKQNPISDHQNKEPQEVGTSAQQPNQEEVQQQKYNQWQTQKKKQAKNLNQAHQVKETPPGSPQKNPDPTQTQHNSGRQVYLLLFLLTTIMLILYKIKPLTIQKRQSKQKECQFTKARRKSEEKSQSRHMY